MRTLRVVSWSMTFERPVGVWLDGRSWAAAGRLELAVEPDALAVVI